MTNFLKKWQCSIHRLGFVFTLSLIPTVVFLALVYLLIHLGFWQLERAHFKQKLEHEFKQQQPLAAQDFKAATIYPAFTKVKLNGYYDNTHTFLLDNSILNHRVGFQVVTAVRTAPSAELILVDRGWVAGSTNRQDLPKIPSVLGLQPIKGLILNFPNKGFVLAEQKPSTTWPQLVERLKRSELEALLKQPLNPQIIRLNAGEHGAFLNNPSQQNTLPAQRHYAYAFQWFALALTLVIIWLTLSIRRDLHETH